MSDEILSQSDQTRRQILSAAHDLFVQNGFHGASMRQIATQAGIALGGIYNHFPSKESIFIEVLLSYHPYRQILEAMRAAEGHNLEEFVHNSMAAILTSVEKQPEFLNLMLIEIVEFNSQHVQQLYNTLFPQFFGMVEPFMARQNNLRPVPILMLMRIFIGFFFSFYITEKLLGGSFPAEMKIGALDHFVDVLLHGIVDPNLAGASPRSEDNPTAPGNQDETP